MKTIHHLFPFCLLGALLLALPAVVQAQFTFTTNPDGSLNIQQYTGYGGAVVIPATTDGLPVTTIGEYAFYDNGANGNAFYGWVLTSVTIGTNVTSIGDYAFEDCFSLTSVTIPNSVTSIGDGAFDGCSLTSVTIPNSVTNIGGGAFSGCSLTSVTIPDSVTNIGTGVFYGCSSLKAITVDANNPAFSSVAGVLFNKNQTTLVEYPGDGARNYMIPNSVTCIATNAFSRCLLTNVMIPNSVTSIGDYAFDECYNLTSVTISTNVTSIPGYAFWLCEDLTNVTIPNSVTNIEYDAFAGCSLTSVTIGSSVSYIGADAFLENHITHSVFFLGNAPTTLVADAQGAGPFNYTVGTGNYGQTTFYYLPGTSGWTSNGVPRFGFQQFFWNPQVPFGFKIVNGTISIGDYFGSSGAVSIPSEIDNLSVTSIGDYAFANCTNLTSITIPNSVTSIGNYAFAGLWLDSITIPNSVNSIGEGAFQSCINLTGVSIPASVSYIGDVAFDSCTNLSVVFFQGNAPGAGPWAFDNNETAYYLPGTTGWGAWFDVFYDYPGIPTALWNPQAPLQVTTTSLQNGTDWMAYRQTMAASGGQTPIYSWSLVAGVLPPGLTLATNGVISGTPTNIGTNNFTVKVTDALSQIATQSFTLTVVLPSILVLNGDFETGDFSGWTSSGNFTYTSVVTGSMYAHSGTYGAKMGPSGSLGYLSKTLATTAGTSYLLSFWVDSNGTTPNEFLVSWDGTTLFDQTNLGAVGWTNLQFVVSATGSSTVLQFGFRDDHSYLGLDDISVVSLTASPSPIILSTPKITVGKTNFTFLLSGPAGSNYVLQVSTNLLNWNPVSTSAIPVSGTVNLTNAITNYNRRFYRAVIP
jgi:hypothetical protein